MSAQMEKAALAALESLDTEVKRLRAENASLRASLKGIQLTATNIANELEGYGRDGEALRLLARMTGLQESAIAMAADLRSREQHDAATSVELIASLSLPRAA